MSDFGKIDQTNIKDVLSYHPLDENQRDSIDELRAAAKVFGDAILQHAPPSQDRQQALTHLRAALFWANSSVALEGKV